LLAISNPMLVIGLLKVDMFLDKAGITLGLAIEGLRVPISNPVLILKLLKAGMFLDKASITLEFAIEGLRVLGQSKGRFCFIVGHGTNSYSIICAT